MKKKDHKWRNNTADVFYFHLADGGRHYTLLTENIYVNERKQQLNTLIRGFIH